MSISCSEKYLGWKEGNEGSLSGDICRRCGSLMVIEQKENGAIITKCQECGRTSSYYSNNSLHRSAYV
jgi:uncharacterized OB-fold protein